MKRKIMMLCASAAFASLAMAEPPAMRPAEAVAGAKANPNLGIEGVFEFTVVATGRTQQDKKGVIVHLNSEEDYRKDASVTIYTDTTKALEKVYGAPLEETLKGKRISVKGRAKRAKIVFTDSLGHYMEEYYFQTHVDVRSADQIHAVS